MAMRHSVLLLVWLGLVLSLLKEGAAQSANSPTTVTPTTRTTVSSTPTGTTPQSKVTTSPTPTVSSTPTGTTPQSKVTTSPTPTESSTPTGATPESKVTTSPTPTVSSTPTGATPESKVTTSQTPTESSTPTGATPESKVTTSPTATESSTPTGATPESKVTTSPTPTGSTPTGTTHETTVTTSPILVDFCHGDPCGINSATCISLNSNYTCVCKYGFYYNNENCYRGKVFPATIAVNTNYTDSVRDVNSTEYEDLFNNLSTFFEAAFENLTGYVETVIVEIRPPSKSRNSAPLSVTVTNLFTWDSPEDNNTVYSAVKLAIEKENQSYVESYLEARHCDIYQCDTKTTVCKEGTFPECKCKSDLEKTEWDDRSCSACSKNCSAAKHKYCVKEAEVPTCKCMANFKTQSGDCVPCPVGYSGEECTDNSELILIIVGTVFGAIILSLVIAVSIISVRAKHKQNPETRSLIKSGYSDMNTSDDRPSMFPRVQTTSGHANPGYQPNNPYEMRSKNRDHFPERDYDDMYETSREPRGFRTQSRY